MIAKVIKEFTGAKDGEFYPTLFRVGDRVEGKLAAVAVAEKWAMADKRTSAEPPAQE